MLEGLVVGTIVTAAALYAIWALLPIEARRRLARRLVATSTRGRWPAWLRRGAAALDQRARATGDPCGSCGARPDKDDTRS